MASSQNVKNDTVFDEEGFLTDSQNWNEEIAQNIAYNDGIGKLTQYHFSVIKHLREHFFKTGSVTPLRFICHESQLGSHCIHQLFSSHGIEAWKIAGLPYPGEEVKTYM
ncbi:MAG: TusE/DsrC/DsvC family sulfur relay protein [Thiohalomonadales bacterium]